MGPGPELKLNGADVVAGQFGGWVPIGAVQTASGYDVAWEMPGTNKYTVWTTDSKGNYPLLYRRRVGNQHCVGIVRTHFRPGLERRWSDRHADGDPDRYQYVWIDQPDPRLVRLFS